MSTLRKGNGSNKKDPIYFEHQIDNHCALHSLNMALQSEAFSISEFKDIARQLDIDEYALKDAGQKPRVLSKIPSKNFTQVGFSVQVIIEAARIHNLELLSLQSNNDESKHVMKYLELQKAFLCLSENHWFAIRRFANQWFVLNSQRGHPFPLLDIRSSINGTLKTGDAFVLLGTFPPCEGDKAYCPTHTCTSSTQPTLTERIVVPQKSVYSDPCLKRMEIAHVHSSETPIDLSKPVLLLAMDLRMMHLTSIDTSHATPPTAIAQCDENICDDPTILLPRKKTQKRKRGKENIVPTYLSPKKKKVRAEMNTFSPIMASSPKTKSKSIPKTNETAKNIKKHKKSYCDEHKKSFPSHADFLRHMRSSLHAEPDRWCYFCKKGESRDDNLFRHMKTHPQVHLPRSLTVIRV